jgi:hypothetical protein
MSGAGGKVCRSRLAPHAAGPPLRFCASAVAKALADKSAWRACCWRGAGAPGFGRMPGVFPAIPDLKLEISKGWEMGGHGHWAARAPRHTWRVLDHT